MSQRDIDATLQANAESPEFLYVLFVDLDFPTGTIYAHNSVGTLSFGGNDYFGVGGFGSIEMMRESKELVDQPVDVILSSITPEIIEAVKVDDVYGREANIYIGTVNQDNELEGTPTNWIAGFMDSVSVHIGQRNAVAIKVQTQSARLLRENNKRWTLEDHQTDYPGDNFFKSLPWVVTAEPTWGGEKVRDRYSTGVSGRRDRTPDR